MRKVFFFFLILVLAACDANAVSPGPVIQSDEGGALLAEATRAAARVISDRKTATIQAATMVAGATDDAIRRASTATAQSQQVRQTDMAANATSNALVLQQMQTRQSATGTSEAQRGDATQTAVNIRASVSATAEAHAVQRSLEMTSVAGAATSTAYAATSTRSAQDLAASLARLQATATVEALNRQREQAVQDAARHSQWMEFFDSVLKLVLGLGSLATVLLGVVALARYLDTLALRSRMMETRDGTVMIVYTNGRPHAQLIRSSQDLLESGTEPEEFTESQAPRVESQALDLLKVTNPQGTTAFIPRNDPAEDARQARHHLAMRLLRESMSYLHANKIDPRATNSIPSFRDLNWSSETWVRAIESLKPHVYTKRGRGGGTFCGDQFPTVMQLYSALGEHRITLGEPEATAPSLGDVSQAA